MNIAEQYNCNEPLLADSMVLYCFWNSRNIIKNVFIRNDTKIYQVRNGILFVYACLILIRKPKLGVSINPSSVFYKAIKIQTRI